MQVSKHMLLRLGGQRLACTLALHIKQCCTAIRCLILQMQRVYHIATFSTAQLMDVDGLLKPSVDVLAHATLLPQPNQPP